MTTAEKKSFYFSHILGLEQAYLAAERGIGLSRRKRNIPEIANTENVTVQVSIRP